MALIDVVYKSLLLFATLFSGVLLLSYISYKIKNRGKKKRPYLNDESNSTSPQQIIPKDNSFMKSSVYSERIPNAGNREKPSHRGSYSNRSSRTYRYTKVDTLYNPVYDSGGQNPNRTSVDLSVSYGKEQRTQSEVYAPKGIKYGNHSIIATNVLSYYDDQNEDEFYLFKTKY